MLTKSNLKSKINEQISCFNYDNSQVSIDNYILEEALYRTNSCLKHKKSKYVNDKIINSALGFNPYNSVQYSIFLYYLSNSYYHKYNNNRMSEMLYLLNKKLNCVEIYYNRELPEYWYMEHPLGSIIGNATYSNGITIYQGVTIGANRGAIRPIFNGFAILYTNSTLVGDCKIGKNVIVSANCYIKETNIPDNSIVFGSSPNLIIKQKTEQYMDDLFSNYWK